MALQFKDGYITSVFGRRIALQTLTSGESGSTTYTPGLSAPPEFLIGPDGVRMEVTTDDTTSTKLKAWGISVLATADTTKSVYILDPPIAGVRKIVHFGSSGTATNSIHLQANAGTDNTVGFNATGGTTMCCIHSTQGYQATVSLLGINSTSWAMATLSTEMLYQSTVTT